MQTENQANLEEKLTWLQCCKVHRGAEGVGIEGKAPEKDRRSPKASPAPMPHLLIQQSSFASDPARSGTAPGRIKIKITIKITKRVIGLNITLAI